MISSRGLTVLTNLDTMTFSGLQILFFTLVPLIAEKSQLSASSVIAAFSVGSFMFLWASPFWAARSDQWGRRTVLAIAMSGLTLSTALLILLLTWESKSETQSLSLLWGSRLLYGLTVAGLVPVAQALRMDLAPKESVMRALISNSMSLNLGRALGPLYILVGSIASLNGVLMGALVWAVVLTLLHFVGFPKPPPPASSAQAPEDWRNALRKMKPLFSLALIFTSFIGVLNFSLALVLKKTFSLTSEEAGVLMAQLLLVSAFLVVLSQTLGRKLYKNPWQGPLMIGGASLLIGASLLAVTNSYVSLWAAILFLSIGIALLPPSYMALMADRAPVTQGLGQRTGLMNSANTLGYAIGGMLAAGALKISAEGSAVVLLLLAVAVLGNIAWLYRGRWEVAHV